MSNNENLIKIFEYALNQEKTGMTFFETSIQRMGVGEAVSAFKTLIEEEKRHIAFITQILEDLKGKGEVDLSKLREIALEPTDYFDDRAKKEFLEQCLYESMVPDVAVFNTAWLIEKDLSEFYEKMAEKAEGEAKMALLMLARWEKSHEKFFKEYREQLTEAYSKMAWGG
ncbi:MAG: ferritin family protein [Nitrospirota bacterium]|nr:ferritin family protein [Nitrospirota bacterium]